MTAYLDWAENFHPYECDGPGKCRHCDRRIIHQPGDETPEHHPRDCALCDPEYDGGPPWEEK